MAKIEHYFDALVSRFGDLQWLEVAIQRQDGFTAVVRTVALIETMLNDAIREKLVLKDCVEDYTDVRIEWASLVRFCFAVGVITLNLRSVLLELGHLRNRFAHQHAYEVTADDVKRLIKKIEQNDFNEDFRVQRETVAGITTSEVMIDLAATLNVALVNSLFDTARFLKELKLAYVRTDTLADAAETAIHTILNLTPADRVELRGWIVKNIGKNGRPCTPIGRQMEKAVRGGGGFKLNVIH